MVFDKKIIKGSFSKAAGTYDSNAFLQKEVAAILAERVTAVVKSHAVLFAGVPDGVSAFPVKTILDIGCGTCFLTELLGTEFPGSMIYGCDIAHPMLVKSRSKGQDNLVQSDCEYLPFADFSFDIAASSLAFQWAGDLNRVFKEAKRVLKPGGLFYFATLGPETLHELKTCRSKFSPEYTENMNYFSASELSGKMEEAGFKNASAETDKIIRTYKDLPGLLRSLKNIGAAPPVDGGSLPEGIALRKAGRIYKELFPSPDGKGIAATYEVIYISARNI